MSWLLLLWEFYILNRLSLSADLGRMYNLVSRITDGLGELKKLLETHIYNQGLAAIEKCGEAALNVSVKRGSNTNLMG